MKATLLRGIPIFQALRHWRFQNEVGRVANQLISFDFKLDSSDLIKIYHLLETRP